MNTKSETFCILPWMHINVGLPDVYRPCCNTGKAYRNNNNKEITINDYSFKEAFNGPEIKLLREQLNNGERPSICDVCWKKEDAGISSEREFFNGAYTTSWFEEQADGITLTGSRTPNYSKLTKPTLKFLDMEFDNICNLQCRMCSQHSSDQIWKTFDLLTERGLPIPTSLQNHDRSNQYKYKPEEKKQYAKEMIAEGIDTFKVTGGEPMLSKDFLEIIDFCVDNGFAEDMILRITSNGTKFSKTILDKLKAFKLVRLTISVDGTGNTYEYIRYPFTWKQIDKRLKEIMSHPWIRTEYSCVVQAYNWLNIHELINYVSTNGNTSYNYINFDFKMNPLGSEFSPEYLPDWILDEGLDRIQKVALKNKAFDQIVDFENFVEHSKQNRLPDNQLERKWDLLYETTINYDIVRNQSYKTLDPLFVQWLKTLKI